MSKPPACWICQRQAEPKNHGRHAYHRHCCYSCFLSSGQKHEHFCSRKWFSDPNWWQRSWDGEQEQEQDAVSQWKRRRIESAVRSSSKTKDNDSFLDADVEFKLVFNLVLNRCSENKNLQERWKDLFRVFNTRLARGDCLQTLHSLYVLPQEVWKEISGLLPDLHRVDTRIIDCRGILGTYGGHEIFRKGGKSTLLQEWIIQQENTVRLLHALLEELEQNAHPLIVFTCRKGRHRSLSLAEVFVQLFAPHVRVFCLDDIDIDYLRTMVFDAAFGVGRQRSILA